MNNINRLPAPFLKARLALINQELQEIPSIGIGKHGDIEVIRAYNYLSGHRTCTEHKLCSPRGQELLNKHKRRQYLLGIRKQIEALIPSSADSVMLDPLLNVPFLDEQFWNSLKSQSNTYKADSHYEYKQFRMRSRGEVIIAQVLDSLGLIYKYEPVFQIGSKYYSPDFVVYLPELKRCFIIEFLGRLDDDGYLDDNLPKIRNYLKSGMVINKDLLLFNGYINTMVSPDEVLDDLIALIQKLCRMNSTFSSTYSANK